MMTALEEIGMKLKLSLKTNKRTSHVSLLSFAICLRSLHVISCFLQSFCHRSDFLTHTTVTFMKEM